MKSNIKTGLYILLSFIILIEVFATGYNIKRSDANTKLVEYLNPFEYLQALIYPQKKVKIAFPRIVKNGCGKYAVQTKMSISRTHSFSDDPIPSKTDTTYHYIGIRHPDWNIWDVGGAPPLKTPIGFSPSYDIETLKIANRLNVFSGDTTYVEEIGGELMFDKEQDAYNAMMSYTHKQILVQMFNDSIDNCHNYKP